MSIAEPFSFTLHFPDAEFEQTFRAYSNYLQDLAGLIAGEHGFGASLAAGVAASVAQAPGIGRVRRRRLSPEEMRALDAALRKAWQNLRRVAREVEDAGDFDEEANAWLPAQAYYGVYHAILAFAIASGQRAPRNHRAALSMIADEAQRGRLPFPWSLCCTGCPQTGTQAFSGSVAPGAVHVLSSPSTETAEDRFAMFLRTTRAKELERILDAERGRGVAKGGARRRIPAAEKERHAAKLTATTIFDLFYRLRKKAHYDDANTFVLGAAGPRDAGAFAQSLAYVTDGTVAAVEGLIAAYTGPEAVAHAASSYSRRVRCSTIDGRAAVWAQRAARTSPVRTRP